MYKLLILLLAVAIMSCSGTGSKSHNNYESINMSPKTKIFFQELSAFKNDKEFSDISDEFINEYNIRNIDGNLVVGALIKVKDNAPEFKEDGGIIVRTTAGKILTLFVNLKNFEDLFNFEEIDYIQIDDNIKLIQQEKK